MTAERAIKILKFYGPGLCPDSYMVGEAFEMAIKALERQIQTKRAIEVLHEMSAKYAEMYLDTDPDTDDHILDRIRYREAVNIYANAANLVKQLVMGNDDAVRKHSWGTCEE